MLNQTRRLTPEEIKARLPKILASHSRKEERASERKNIRDFQKVAADVKVGELTCRTPCSLAIPVSGEQTAVFTLNGYQAASETLQVVTANGPPTLQPNPVAVELTPAPPPPSSTLTSGSVYRFIFGPMRASTCFCCR